jgi:hypothetical protein
VSHVLIISPFKCLTCFCFYRDPYSRAALEVKRRLVPVPPVPWWSHSPDRSKRFYLTCFLSWTNTASNTAACFEVSNEAAILWSPQFFLFSWCPKLLRTDSWQHCLTAWLYKHESRHIRWNRTLERAEPVRLIACVCEQKIVFWWNENISCYSVPQRDNQFLQCKWKPKIPCSPLVFVLTTPWL